MNLNGKWQLVGLNPTPEEEWWRLKDFLGLGSEDIQAMLQTVEPLLKRGHELVVGTYDYLRHRHDTAVILGWDQSVDEAHLAERRRFFTIWLARMLGLDFSDDFARYLFRAGQIHAGHGPRQIHVPDLYVTGAISLVNATFAQFLKEEMPGAEIVPAALAGWNKVLSLHLHMMLNGYKAAQEMDSGEFSVRLSAFGRMRDLLGWRERLMHLSNGDAMDIVLRKFFNYFPQVRAEVLDVEWSEAERLDTTGRPWSIVEKIYRIKGNPDWRVLLNGRDLRHIGGLGATVSPDDEIHIFPPGR